MASTKGIVPRKSNNIFVKAATINGRGDVRVSMDTGSIYTLIKRSIALEHKLKLISEDSMLLGHDINEVVMIRCRESVWADIKIEGISVGPTKMIIVQDTEIKYDIIVGREWLAHPLIGFRKEQNKFIIVNRLYCNNRNLEMELHLYQNTVTINGKHNVEMKIDTGCHLTLLRIDFAEKFNLELEDCNPHRYLSSFNTSWNLRIKYKTLALLKIDEVTVQTWVYIPECMVVYGIIGTSFLNSPNVSFRKRKNDILFIKN